MTDAATADAVPVTVVIPAYDEADVLADGIPAILEHPAASVMIVYEADCTDDTAAVAAELAAEHDRVIAVENPEPHAGSKAGAINHAIETAETDLLAVIDADHEIAPETLRRGVERFEADPDLAYLSGRAMKKDDGFWGGMAYGENQLFYTVPTFLMDRLLGFHFPTSGTCMLRGPLVAAAGGFDTGTLTEDMDIGAKLQRAGAGMAFDPDFVTRETVPCTVRDWWAQRKRWIRGAVQVSRKHRRTAPDGVADAAMSTMLAAYPLLFPVVLGVVLGLLLSAPGRLALGGAFLLLSGLVAAIAVRDTVAGHLSRPTVYHLLSPVTVLAAVVIGLHAVYEELTGAEQVWHSVSR